MKIIPGTGEVPVIYTAHHASHDFGEFESRVALSTEQKIRFSDYGTDLTVPANGLVSLIAEHSRALGDLNRDPKDLGMFQDQDYAKINRNDIWKLGNGLTEKEKELCLKKYYWSFHNEIINQLKIGRNLLLLLPGIILHTILLGQIVLATQLS
jgi:N-formylglutamate amidohydrolase